jgi:quercetin dioxygenase-like cupin family protein
MSPTTKGIQALRDLPEEKISDQITRRILVGEKEMIVWWSMKAGAHAAAHKHPHEQAFWVISGRMDFRLGGERRMCQAGDVGVVPGGVEHEAKWLTSPPITRRSPTRTDWWPGVCPGVSSSSSDPSPSRSWSPSTSVTSRPSVA